MDLRGVMTSLLDRPYTSWPAFVCGAIDDRVGRVCHLPARWQRLPIREAEIAWTYCDHHKPENAELIPDDVTYSVARLELRIAVAGRPGQLEASAVDAVRSAVFALEDIGAVVTGIRVIGAKATQDAAGQPPMRLQLAGRPRPIPAERPFVGPPEQEPWWSWRRRRQTG